MPKGQVERLSELLGTDIQQTLAILAITGTMRVIGVKTVLRMSRDNSLPTDFVRDKVITLLGTRRTA